MAERLRLYAAGSLSAALSELGMIAGCRVCIRFGPSGTLRQEIERGAAWDVFASADTAHPARLHAAGLGTPPRAFCSNSLCLILHPDIGGTDVTALLLRTDLRLGISTPGSDPSGDYAIAALARLDPAVARRALRLTGAPGCAAPPSGRNPYAWLITSGAADIIVTYRSNAIAARADTPALRTCALPAELRVVARYALTTRQGAVGASALAEYILSSEIQQRLQTLGFRPVDAGAAAQAPA